MSTLSIRLKSLATNQTTTVYPIEVRYVLREREREMEDGIVDQHKSPNPNWKTLTRNRYPRLGSETIKPYARSVKS